MATTGQGAGLRLVYLVHDLGDAAVARRLAMLQPWLQSAVVIGFYRGARPPVEVLGWPAIALGRTADRRLGHRIFAVLHTRILRRRLRRHLQGATVVMARQLEMLTLARGLRRRYAPSATLAYECLDIHRLMVGQSIAALALRRLEAVLLRSTDLVVVSSPAFLREHLEPMHGARLPPACVIENKVLHTDLGSVPDAADRPAGPPWRIGWCGVLRCRRSLGLLDELTRRLAGRVIVELRGRPARSAIPDFDAVIAANPALQYIGPYDRRRDLPLIYRAVHFTWAIDYYEAGANSQWLLPNRLYEGGLHGAVPIALGAVETGAWLARAGAGVLLGDPPAADLLRYFDALQPAGYAEAVQRLTAVPRSAWIDDGDDGARLARLLDCGATPVAPATIPGGALLSSD